MRASIRLRAAAGWKLSGSQMVRIRRVTSFWSPHLQRWNPADEDSRHAAAWKHQSASYSDVSHPAAGQEGEDVVCPDVEVHQVLAHPLDENGVAGRPRQPVVANPKDDHVRHSCSSRPAHTRSLANAGINSSRQLSMHGHHCTNMREDSLENASFPLLGSNCSHHPCHSHQSYLNLPHSDHKATSSRWRQCRCSQGP